MRVSFRKHRLTKATSCISTNAMGISDVINAFLWRQKNTYFEDQNYWKIRWILQSIVASPLLLLVTSWSIEPLLLICLKWWHATWICTCRSPSGPRHYKNNLQPLLNTLRTLNLSHLNIIFQRMINSKFNISKFDCVRYWSILKHREL